MRKLILAVLLIVGPASVMAEPERIKDDPVESPCDNSPSTEKPPCNTDSESVTVPAPMPTERDSVIVPPDIPAEGLPHQEGDPSSGNSTTKPQR